MMMMMVYCCVFPSRMQLPVTEVGLFKSCLNVLSAMLEDNHEIGGDVHIERLFLFCLMWTFGGLLGPVDQKRFSDVLTTLSNAYALPPPPPPLQRTSIFNLCSFCFQCSLLSKVLFFYYFSLSSFLDILEKSECFYL